MRKTLQICSVVLCGLVCLWLLLAAGVAYVVVMPKSRTFDDIAELGGHKVESIVLQAADGKKVSGWYVPLKSERAMVFTHGIGGDRRHQLTNMEFYLSRGYAALTIDLRGHGKSSPELVSMGLHERHDLMGAIAFLRAKGYEHIGADGISLGAATIAYAFQDKPQLDFIILESSYDTVENALNNRVAMVGAPVWLAWPFRQFASVILGVAPKDLRPVDWMDDITVPTLVLAGDSEAEIHVHETQSLYDACKAEIKEMFLFPGARHQHRFVHRYPEEYARVVDSFLAKVYPGQALSLTAN